MPIDEKQQLTHRQHAVPQNIMDVEFKLIGDLTMRQFFYLVIFGGLAYGSFMAIGSFIKWPFVFFFVMAGIALAFIPLNERGLDEWVNNFFRSIYMPSQRVWRKEVIVPQAFAFENLEMVKQEMITLAPTSSRRKLENYLEHYSETEEKDLLDVDITSYVKKVRDAFANTKTTTVTAPPMARPRTTQAPIQAPPQQIPQIPSVEPGKKPEQQQQEPTKDSATAQQQKQSQGSLQPKPPKGIQLPKHLVGVEAEHEQPLEITVPQSIFDQEEKDTLPEEQGVFAEAEIQEPQTSDSEIILSGGKPSAADTPQMEEQEVPLVNRREEEFIIPTTAGREEEPLLPVTPDRLPGRKFTQLVPEEGQIVLPIRGERILKTEEFEKKEEEIDEELRQKTAQLQKLLDEIKKDSEVAEKIKQKPEEKEKSSEIEKKEKLLKEKAQQLSDENAQMKKEEAEIAKKQQESQNNEEKQKLQEQREDLIHKMIEENAKLNEEINRLKTEMAQAQGMQKNIENQNTVISRAEEEQEKLKEQIQDLSKKLEEQAVTQRQQILADSKEEKAEPQVVEPSFARMQPITDAPNIVSGIVRNSQGDPLQGVVVIIKKAAGDPVRAIKTNILGQFAITTPISNGEYTIEVDKSNKTGLIFDIIKLRTKGEVIPPIEFTGR